MANPNPPPPPVRQPSETHTTEQVRVYITYELLARIKRLPKGTGAKTLGRWLQLGMEADKDTPNDET